MYICNNSRFNHFLAGEIEFYSLIGGLVPLDRPPFFISILMDRFIIKSNLRHYETTLRPLDVMGDKNLSFGGLGLLMMLFEYPLNTILDVESMRYPVDSNNKFYSFIRNLEINGYIKSVPRLEDGKFAGWDFEVYEDSIKK